MNPKRRFALLWRWSLLSSAAIALFWAIWWMIAGDVPEVYAIKITPTETTYIYPMSRWFDILNGPLWSLIMIMLFTRKTDSLFAFLGLFIGWAGGLYFVGPGVPGAVIPLTAVMTLIAGFAFVYKGESNKVSEAGIGLGLGASLFISLFYGLAAGTAVLSITLVIWFFGATVGSFFKGFVNMATLKQIGRFLTAADKAST